MNVPINRAEFALVSGGRNQLVAGDVPPCGQARLLVKRSSVSGRARTLTGVTDAS